MTPRPARQLRLHRKYTYGTRPDHRALGACRAADSQWSWAVHSANTSRLLGVTRVCNNGSSYGQDALTHS